MPRKCNVPAIIRLWYAPDIIRHIVPMKLMKRSDVKHLPHGGEYLADLKFMMGFLEDMGRDNGVVLGRNLTHEVLTTFIETVVPVFWGLLSNSKRKSTLTWVTYACKLRKFVRNAGAEMEGAVEGNQAQGGEDKENRDGNEAQGKKTKRKSKKVKKKQKVVEKTVRVSPFDDGRSRLNEGEAPKAAEEVPVVEKASPLSTEDDGDTEDDELPPSAFEPGNELV